MRKCLLKSLMALITVGVMLSLAGPASAQWRGRLEYGWYSRASVNRLIRQAENASDRFVMVFDRALDRSRLDQTIREERLNDRARDLERQLNIVREESERGGNRDSIRSGVANAIDMSRRINTVMRNRQFNYAAERQWSILRSDLNRLARIFNLAQLD